MAPNDAQQRSVAGNRAQNETDPLPRKHRKARRLRGMLIAIVTLIAAGVAIWMLAPREFGLFDPPDIADLPDNLDAYLFAQDSSLRPEVARQIVWAGAPGQKTPVALVYLHGFSATAQELRPVPDLVAAWRGANLHFARLTGHGSDGASLAAARVQDWARDVAEAVEIGRQIGDKVVLIGTSTGATLAALAARDASLGPKIDAVVMVSPNFALQNRWAFLLHQPLARHWLPLIAGGDHCTVPANARHQEFWTNCYPTAALLPMAALVAEAGRAEFDRADQPLLLIWSDADQVVDPQASGRALESWGGNVTPMRLQMGPQDDRASHVIAGDILSPGQTVPVAEAINDWVIALFGE